MRIAVLLTGRANLFSSTEDHILKTFENLAKEGNTIDFFCHSWKDDFKTLDYTMTMGDIKDNIVDTTIYNINSVNPKTYVTTSYHDIIRMIETYTAVYAKGHNLSCHENLFLINYLSPQMSAYYAIKSLVDYVEETGTTYDLVIKWRYDLLTHVLPINYKFEENTLYVNYLDNTTFDDRFYYGSYATMTNLILLSPEVFLMNCLETVYHMSPNGDPVKREYINRENRAWFFNRILKDTYSEIDNNLNYCINKEVILLTIMRSNLKKSLTIEQINDYNLKYYDTDVAWDKRVVDDPAAKPKRKILVAGCSHVYGSGLPDCKTPESGPSEYAWPALLRKDFGCDIINLSKPGNSLGDIANKLMYFYPKHKLSGILLIAPHSGRFLIKNEELPQNNNIDNFMVTRIHRYSKEVGDAALKYIEYLNSDEIEKTNFLSYLSYVLLLGKELKIPVWVSVSTQEDYEFLAKQDCIKLNTNISWYEHYKQLDYPLTDCKHFDYQAHEHFYKNHIKPWAEKHIFSKDITWFE